MFSDKKTIRKCETVLLATALILASICSLVSAQIWSDNFESYEAGSELTGQGGWSNWYNRAGVTGMVSDKYAFRGRNSLEVGPATDTVQEWDLRGGRYILTVRQYIPSGSSGTSIFALCSRYGAGSQEMNLLTRYQLSSGTITSDRAGLTSIQIIYDEWVEIKVIIDLDTRIVEEYYDAELIVRGIWSANNTWQNVDIWSDGASPIYYDDFRLTWYVEPNPADGAVDVACATQLSWWSSDAPLRYDVYFGTSYEDVKAATATDPRGVLVSIAQKEPRFDPGQLEIEKTYYWRVDSVDAALGDVTPTGGRVWRFTTEPYVYAITNIIATSNGISDEASGPQRTVDGSGLDNEDRHSLVAADMWLADPPQDEALYIQYEFDRVYKLQEMLVWNYNSQFEMVLGFGVKEVTIELSADGADWTVFGEVEFARATARADYSHNTTVDLGGVAAKYVRLTVNSGWGMLPQYGLSEVRFLHLPVQARYPSPEDEASDVSPNTALGWRAGREAVVHEVYLCTDLQAVAQGAALIDVVVDAWFDPGPLELDTTYYWRIDAVNEAEAIRVWEGELWSFSTADYLVVEDFESYTDAEGNRIYEVWIDGLDVDGNGSQVGHDNAPYAERTLVHSGQQSMPLVYANVGSVTDSEATLSFDKEQDWTARGATTLVVYFRGSPDNGAAQLYLKLNDTRVNYDGVPASLAVPVWKQWDVDLAALGAAARSVRTLTIGVSGPGSGKLYVDDIRLHRVAPPAGGAPVAVDPGTDGLAAYYAMENDVQDGSGNDRHGAMMGGSGFGPGTAGYGEALVLDGSSGHVMLPIGPLVQSLRSATFATWVNWAGGGVWQRIFDFGNNTGVYMFLTPSSGAGTLRFAITTGSNTGESMVQAPAALPQGGWHHVAVTIDGDTKEMKLYLDGHLVGSAVTAKLPADLGNTTQNWLGRSQWPDPYFNGSLDDFRIYSRALSEAEVRYFVGDR